MPSAPLPPFLPESLEAFTDHVTAHTPDWFKYCREAYEYIGRAEAVLNDIQEKALQSDLRVQALEKEISHLKHEHERQLDRLQGARDHQEEQLQRMTMKLVEALKERDQAISLATPIVVTPLSLPVPGIPAERATAPIPRTLTPTTTSAPESTRLSERLPDPEKFEGDRKDLRRFISQIHEKMKVNHDRFPTAQSRMTYVTNRLKGQPYAQILPYIKDGECQLSDYNEVLRILDRAFGDPNRINNARNDLFRLRQTNKDFSLFLAEFQRLALEGEMSEDALPVLLEQAINRELRTMLIHHEPPSRQYYEFANFLQDLENRRRYYENAPGYTPKIYAAAAKTRPTTVSPVSSPAAPTMPAFPKLRDPDAMDLGHQRRRPTSPSSRRDRGECFRCGSSSHLVRNCPLPDTRGVKILGSVQGRPTSPGSEGSSTRSPSPNRSRSVKGASLD